MPQSKWLLDYTLWVSIVIKVSVWKIYRCVYTISTFLIDRFNWRKVIVSRIYKTDLKDRYANFVLEPITAITTQQKNENNIKYRFGRTDLTWWGWWNEWESILSLYVCMCVCLSISINALLFKLLCIFVVCEHACVCLSVCFLFWKEIWI